MAVYIYTGKLTDFGEAPFPEANPRLWVEPEADAFSPSGPAAAKRIPITVATNGNFSVDLTASADLIPPAKYSLRCEWFAADATGQDGLIGWSQWNFVAAYGGGEISTMPNGFTRVWYSVSAPPLERRGIYWVHPTTGDVKEWSD